MRAYLDSFNGSGQDASSTPGPSGVRDENVLPAHRLSKSDIVGEYDTTTSSLEVIESVQAAMEPQTSTSTPHEDVSTDRFSAESQEPDMDEMDREWINARLEAAQERANAQMANTQARIDIGIAHIESQVAIIGENVRQLRDVISDIRVDGRETRSEINRLVNRIEETEKDTKKELHEIKTHQTGMRLWYLGTTIALFLAVLAILTFGKDMFEWGRSLPQ